MKVGSDPSPNRAPLPSCVTKSFHFMNMVGEPGLCARLWSDGAKAEGVSTRHDPLPGDPPLFQVCNAV